MWEALSQPYDGLKTFQPIQLSAALDALRGNRLALRALGVVHAGIFGSVARGEARTDSDVDVLIDLDASKVRSIFEYCEVRLAISDLFGGKADVVSRDSLRPRLKDRIISELVDAF